MAGVLPDTSTGEEWAVEMGTDRGIPREPPGMSPHSGMALTGTQNWLGVETHLITNTLQCHVIPMETTSEHQ